MRILFAEGHTGVRKIRTKENPLADGGTGVICETWALQAAVIPAKAPVIPAKAGIHPANLRKCAVEGLDSRFRGNDWRFERDPIPNDTTTAAGR
jgi:hypothetical protein